MADFNPLPRKEGDPDVQKVIKVTPEFQSTPS